VADSADSDSNWSAEDFSDEDFSDEEEVELSPEKHKDAIMNGGMAVFDE